MLENLNLKQVLFIDIETVPQFPDYSSAPEKIKSHWDKKSAFFRGEEQEPSDVFQRAGIYAEFGKIICISVGLITGEKGNFGIKLNSYAGDDENVRYGYSTHAAIRRNTCS